MKGSEVLQITEEIILLCLEELQKQIKDKKIYKDYYDGDHEILNNYDMQDSRSNQKLVFNFPRKFVDNETGYLLGKPVNYVSKSDDDEIVKCIDAYTSCWEKEHNITLRKYSEIFGESYELNYIDKNGEFSATVLTPMNAYVLDDGTADKNVTLAIHKFSKAFEVNEYLDVYTDAIIYHYRLNEEKLEYLGEHSHLFERVPVIVCSANTEAKSGFYDIISLINSYNALNSDLVNEISDHRNAYLIMMDEVNFNENWASNTSSLALRNKLLNLENRVAIREAFMERVIRERLKNLFLYIKKREGKVLDYKDIAIKFTRNLPTDLTGLADVITKLNGVCSKETLLSLLPFVESPTLELQKIKVEDASVVSKDVTGAEELEEK